MTLEELNRLPAAEARAAFERCCGARLWIDRMCVARPFSSRAALFARAAEATLGFTPDDWREAFAHHPRIGDLDALRSRFAATAAWAAGEQCAVATAGEETLRSLAEDNRAYEERFGHTFIVCATGKTADEMLALLRERMDNPPGRELGIASEEQMKITRIRLEKLLDGAP